MPDIILQIAQSAYDQLRSHSEAAYPEECCGILLGNRASDSDSASTTQAIAAPNRSPTPKNHYVIHPLDLIRTQKSAHQAGLEILGFYHSHPDHPAQPSATDLAEAHWLGCSYLITSVRNGQAVETQAFHLTGNHEEDKSLIPQNLEILKS